MIKDYQFIPWGDKDDKSPLEWGYILKYKGETIYQNRAVELGKGFEIQEREAGRGYEKVTVTDRKSADSRLIRIANQRMKKQKEE